MDDRRKIEAISDVIDEFMETGKGNTILAQKIIKILRTRNGSPTLWYRILKTRETISGNSEDKKKIKEVLELFNNYAYRDSCDMTRCVREVKEILEK